MNSLAVIIELVYNGMFFRKIYVFGENQMMNFSKNCLSNEESNRGTTSVLQITCTQHGTERSSRLNSTDTELSTLSEIGKLLLLQEVSGMTHWTMWKTTCFLLTWKSDNSGVENKHTHQRTQIAKTTPVACPPKRSKGGQCKA